MIDDYAAEIVRDIFKWKIDGLSPEMIAKRLNDMGILSPMEYKRSCGIKFRPKDVSQSGWNHITVMPRLEVV